MNKKFIFLIVLASLQFGPVQDSYTQEWQWAKHIGSEMDDYATGAADKEGNFYIAGSFEGGSCQFLTQTLIRHGNNSIFLAKYDKEGNEVWVQQFDVDAFPQGIYDGIGDVIVDKDGFVYITGIFYSTAKFGSFILGSYGGDVFLAKFTPVGTCLWAKKAGGTGKDGGSGLAVDSVKNVYVCGQNNSTALFDSISVPAGGFLAKYDSNGSLLWAKKIVSCNNLNYDAQVAFTCMTIYQDNLFACGWEASSLFTIDTISVNHPGLGGHALSCFNLEGNIKWLKEGISKGAYSGYNMTTDGGGNIFICGEFFDSINFDGTRMFTSPGKDDYFICKYNKNGSHIWAKQCHSTLGASANSVFSDNNGNCYLTGRFRGTATFGLDSINSDTQNDMFLTRYNPDGDFIGIVHFGNAEGASVGMDQAGNPYVVGAFLNSVSIGQNSFSNYGLLGTDIFIARCGKINGIDEKKTTNTNQLLIYANPNEGKCTITLPEEFRHKQHLTLSIYNSQGKLIQQPPVVIIGDKVTLNISAEASGLYNVLLSNGKKNYTGKIIVR